VFNSIKPTTPKLRIHNMTDITNNYRPASPERETYTFEVIEILTRIVHYTVEASTFEEAEILAAQGDTIHEEVIKIDGVIDRDVLEVVT